MTRALPRSGPSAGTGPVEVFRQIVARRAGYVDAQAKLEHARRQQELAARYAQGCAASDARDWDQAVAHFTAVLQADAAYRDAQQRFERASHQRSVTGLQGEARRLSRAKQWAAVVRIGERLAVLDPATADPDGLITAARAELALESVHRQYRAAVRHMDAGAWQHALDDLEQVARLESGYQDTETLLARVRRQIHGRDDPARRPARIAAQPAAVYLFLHRKEVNAVAFSPDGSLLATGGNDKTGRIWEVATRRPLLALQHQGWFACVWGVAFSPAGRWLATASSDKTARIWDASSGQQLTMVTHEDWVKGVAFSPDGRWLATASWDKTARLWDLTGVGDGGS